MAGSTQPLGDEVLDEFDAGSAWPAMKTYRRDLERFVAERMEPSGPRPVSGEK